MKTDPDPFCTTCKGAFSVPCEDCHPTFTASEVESDIDAMEKAISYLRSGPDGISVNIARLSRWRAMLKQLHHVETNCEAMG